MYILYISCIFYISYIWYISYMHSYHAMPRHSIAFHCVHYATGHCNTFTYIYIILYYIILYIGVPFIFICWWCWVTTQKWTGSEWVRPIARQTGATLPQSSRDTPHRGGAGSSLVRWWYDMIWRCVDVCCDCLMMGLMGLWLVSHGITFVPRAIALQYCSRSCLRVNGKLHTQKITSVAS